MTFQILMLAAFIVLIPGCSKEENQENLNSVKTENNEMLVPSDEQQKFDLRMCPYWHCSCKFEKNSYDDIFLAPDEKSCEDEDFVYEFDNDEGSQAGNECEGRPASNCQKAVIGKLVCKKRSKPCGPY